MALLARLMSRGVKRVVNANSSVEPEKSVTVVFVNQIRTKVGVFFGNPEVRPGGKALPFHAMIILEVRIAEKIKDSSGKVIGHRVRIKVPKNKIASPHGTVELDLIYKTGFCKTSSLLDGAIQMDVIKQSGSYFSFGEEKLGQGRQKVIERLKGDAELAKKIEGLARAEYAVRAEWEDPVPAQEEKSLNLGNGHSEEQIPDVPIDDLTAA